MKVLLTLLVFLFFSVQFTRANVIVVSNTNDAGAGSLRAAITGANNYDTIRFDPNMISLGNDTIKLASAINITRNLVIIGVYNSSAALYISGENSFQVFNADLSSVNNPTPKDLTLDSLRFIQGNASTSGGAVKFKGFHLNVRNSIFRNNTATFGGAIASSESYGIVTVNNCTFHLNTAPTSLGGAIYSGGQVILFNADFSDNNALKGGAVYSERKMTIDNSEFTNNTATEAGGAVNLSSNTSTAYYPFAVTNSTFENNSANYGGAIYTYFYNTKVDLIIDNTTFDTNHSVLAGGAVYAASTWYTSSVDINDSRILNSTSDDAGAGIYCKTVYEKATVLLDSCLVANNVAVGIGGGISVSTATQTSSPADTAYMHVANSTIVNNAASKGGGLSCLGTGGAHGASFLVVDNSIVSNNVATIDGGGIYNFSSADNDLGAYSATAHTSVNFSTIDNNQAGANGGGLYSYSYSASSNGPSKSLVYVNQSTFFNNTATNVGGAIGNYSRNNGFLHFNSGVSVEVKNATIYNNNATNGGAVSSKFSSYWSTSDPGSMAVQFSSSIVALNGSNPLYAADSIVSLGYNIFSEGSIPGSIASDQMLIDSASLALGVLQLNGGFTPTLLPGLTSAAINTGNPSDTTDAQNVPVLGIRDVGAAENIAIMSVAECDSFVSPSGNSTYYTSGFYTDTVISSGVDSVIYISLSINKSFSTLVDTICLGDTYISPNGNLHIVSSNFIDTIPNYLGCDSIISISLTVLNPSFASMDTLACASYTAPSGIVYTIPGVYTDTILNVAGCDSIVTINLSFGNTSSSIVETACDQYVSPSGNVYNASGIYTDTISNFVGCDSMITVNLTVLASAIGTDAQTACDAFTWVDGNTYTTSNNSASYTYPGAAANGCDSMVTLDLTILTSSIGTDTQTACDAFTWIDGNTYTLSNSSAQWTVTNAAGCDSLVTLDLTILNSNSGTDVQTACGSYDWIDGNTYTSSNNTAQWIVTNAAGCDSLVTLNLTIITVETGTTQTDDLTIEANAQGANYEWLNCDNNYSVLVGESNQTFTASANGNYAVEITQNGCTDTSACVAITQVGLVETDFGQRIQIFPNPTFGTVTIQLPDGASDLIHVRLKNALGQEIATNSYSHIHAFEVEINGASGVYFLEVETSNGSKAAFRILKQ